VARIDGGAGPLAWHVDFADRSTEDFEIPDLALSDAAMAAAAAAGEPADNPRGSVPNSDSDSQTRAAGLSWVGDRGHLGVSVSRYDTNYGVPGPGEEEEEEEGPGHDAEHSHSGIRIDLEQERIDVRGELRDALGQDSTARVAFASNDYLHHELEGDGIGTVFAQEGREGRIELDHAPFGRWRGTLGLHLVDIDFSAAGAEAYVPPSNTRSFGVFVFEELALDVATFEFGLRLERQQIDVAAASGFPAYDDDAATFSIGAVIPFAKEWKLAAHATRSERHPQSSELYALGPHLAVQRFEIGDPGLGTETGTTFDVSLRRGGHGVELMATAFYNRFDDYIFAAPTDQIEDGLPVARFTQAGAEFYGLETEATVHLLEEEFDHLELRLAADYVRGKLRDGDNLPQMPPLRFGAELHYDSGPWHLGGEIYRYEQQRDVAVNEIPTDGYTILGLEISHRTQWVGAEWLLYLRGTNLLDEEARRHSSLLKEFMPLPGRALVAGLRAEF